MTTCKMKEVACSDEPFENYYPSAASLTFRNILPWFSIIAHFILI